MGIYAFHVVKKTWEKLHDKNLPFVGQAVPLGDGLFAGCPKSTGVAVSVFHLSVEVSPLVPVAVSTATCSKLTSLAACPSWSSRWQRQRAAGFLGSSSGLSEKAASAPSGWGLSSLKNARPTA
ncbi:hypothetical protein E2562_027648 [Oryza meyeriana var. granulata]|uniref:Uncharacterized protein n=1 Tax=Oryza meyeriana var. granulata TaxID=110450 RepID=A0A6G1E3E3_9ORYZ|nr:hypothetical protein E2562_027648 [Oryza meyeriana var. granulata]